LIIKDKVTCLFFDQVNIYAKFRRANELRSNWSTDLSTDFVDKKGAMSPRLALSPAVLVEAAGLR
jgi:hypothetical protein